MLITSNYPQSVPARTPPIFDARSTAVRRAQAQCKETFDQFVALGESVNITMCLGWLLIFFWGVIRGEDLMKFLAWN